MSQTCVHVQVFLNLCNIFFAFSKIFSICIFFRGLLNGVVNSDLTLPHSEHFALHSPHFALFFKLFGFLSVTFLFLVIERSALAIWKWEINQIITILSALTEFDVLTNFSVTYLFFVIERSALAI